MTPPTEGTDPTADGFCQHGIYSHGTPECLPAPASPLAEDGRIYCSFEGHGNPCSVNCWYSQAAAAIEAAENALRDIRISLAIDTNTWEGIEPRIMVAMIEQADEIAEAYFYGEQP